MVSTIARKVAVVLATAGLVAAVPAFAGEGHWSIGKGVQCRLISGVVVCTSTRA